MALIVRFNSFVRSVVCRDVVSCNVMVVEDVSIGYTAGQNASLDAFVRATHGRDGEPGICPHTSGSDKAKTAQRMMRPGRCRSNT